MAKGNGVHWTQADLDKLGVKEKYPAPPPTVSKKGKKQKPPSQEKLAFMRRLKEELTIGGITEKLHPEYRFNPDRMWRFDFAYPKLKIALEYEGIVSGRSRHTTLKGYSNDRIKYNWASINGWIVLSYTALTYEHVLLDLSEIAKNYVEIRKMPGLG